MESEAQTGSLEHKLEIALLDLIDSAFHLLAMPKRVIVKDDVVKAQQLANGNWVFGTTIEEEKLPVDDDLVHRIEIDPRSLDVMDAQVGMEHPLDRVLEWKRELLGVGHSSRIEVGLSKSRRSEPRRSQRIRKQYSKVESTSTRARATKRNVRKNRERNRKAQDASSQVSIDICALDSCLSFVIAVDGSLLGPPLPSARLARYIVTTHRTNTTRYVSGNELTINPQHGLK